MKFQIPQHSESSRLISSMSNENVNLMNSNNYISGYIKHLWPLCEIDLSKSRQQFLHQPFGPYAGKKD